MILSIVFATQQPLHESDFMPVWVGSLPLMAEPCNLLIMSEILCLTLGLYFGRYRYECRRDNIINYLLPLPKPAF